MQTAKGNNYSSATYPYGAMNFHRRVAICFPNSQQLCEVALYCHLKAVTAWGTGGFFKNSPRLAFQ
jgi:hypothetical protein